LRALTGRDPDVIRFLEAQRSVPRLMEDKHQAANRRYLTIAIGCTGGRHRSVYLAEKIAERLAQNYPVVSIRHNSLGEMRSITRAPTLAGASSSVA
jgi:UPF0042 nucleotide-binding protein